MKQGMCVTRRQWAALLFLFLAVDQAVRPAAQASGVQAQVALPAILLRTGVGLALLWPVCCGATGEKARALCTGRIEAAKVFLAFCALLFGAGMGTSAQQAERFFRSASDEPLPAGVVYAVLFGLALYFMHCRLSVLARLGQFLLGGFVVSLALLLVANAGQMQLEHLAVEPFSLSSIVRACAQGAAVAPVWGLVFFFVLCAGRSAVPTWKTWAKAAMWLALLSMAIAFCAELVLGQRAAALLQPLYTLSRLGRISVFKRMDALHVAVWMMTLFAKTAAFGVGAQLALRGLWPNARRWWVQGAAIGLGVLGVLAADRWGQDAVGALLGGGTVVVLATIAMQRGEGAYERKKAVQ